MRNHELHPLCTLFPRLTGAEFDALREDIKANGLRQPIVLHEGMILDGGNRYRACLDAGVEPHFVKFDGGNIVAFVLSANLHRRHLSAGQHAAIVASATNWAVAHKHGGDRRSDQAVTLPLDRVEDRMKVSGASDKTQRMADKVAKAAPDLAMKVAHGEVSLPAAVKQIERPKGPAPQPAPPHGMEADDIPSLEEIVDEQARELEQLHAQIKALTADDTKAELAKQIGIRQGIEARLSDEMEKNKQLDRQLSVFGKWYAELRKITGLDERSAITRFVREAKQAKEAAL